MPFRVKTKRISPSACAVCSTLSIEVAVYTTSIRHGLPGTHKGPRTVPGLQGRRGRSSRVRPLGSLVGRPLVSRVTLVHPQNSHSHSHSHSHSRVSLSLRSARPSQLRPSIVPPRRQSASRPARRPRPSQRTRIIPCPSRCDVSTQPEPPRPPWRSLPPLPLRLWLCREPWLPGFHWGLLYAPVQYSCRQTDSFNWDTNPHAVYGVYRAPVPLLRISAVRRAARFVAVRKFGRGDGGIKRFEWPLQQ